MNDTNGIGISLNPDVAVRGGFNRYDDEDMEIVGAEIKLFDYAGTVSPTPVAELTFRRLDAHPDEGDEEEFSEVYGVGSAKNWAPSPDGKSLIPIGKAKALTDNCRLIIFLANLKNTGYPEKLFTNRIDFLVGTRAHMKRIPAPRTKEKEGAGGIEDKKESTILVPLKLVALPGETVSKEEVPKDAKKKGRSRGDVDATNVAVAGNTSAIEQLLETATKVTLDLLSKNPDGIKKAALLTQAFQHEFLKEFSAKDRNGIVQILFDDKFLGDSPMWLYGQTTQGKIMPRT